MGVHPARVHWTKVAHRLSVSAMSQRLGFVVGSVESAECALRNVLYLHGFTSSPRGRKAAALAGALEPAGFRLIAPDLNIPSFERLDFKVMAKAAFWEVKKHLPAVVVGSSLGAVVALEVARIGLKAPLVLIAPAVGFGRRWIEKLPEGDPVTFFHHGESKELPIHRRFFEQLSKVEEDREPPPVPVIVVMGRRDESVPFDHVADIWRRWEESGGLFPGSRFVEIPDGDHGLVEHAPAIAREILGAARLPI